ncbi:MAG: type VI secretion system tip protein TssI/VgrG [Amaricoccus sp.]
MTEDRTTVVRSSLKEAVTFTHLVGWDAIGEGFAFTLGLTSTDFDIDPLKVVGTPVAVEVESGDPKRWIHGLATEFRLMRIDGERAHYELDLHPWLWLLGQSTDCRIFQGMTVIEIIEKVFADYPLAKVELRLQASYPARDYCVQYDETDLDFVQRLMEHEGIGTFFDYREDGHTLVLFDAMGKLKPLTGYETVPFHFEGQAARRDREYLSTWAPLRRLTPGSYAHTDYDFEKPAADLMAQSEHPFGHAEAGGEVYRHPGAHLALARGDAVATIRREELQAGHQRIRAAGTVRGLASGCTFTLEGFPRADQNVKHLVVRARYRLTDPGHRVGLAPEAETFRIELELAPTALPYRPPRRTPRVVMRGPQTATVVGPAGAEIFTDKYARVKVQFHWDRLGKKDENTTCFIRVSQAWAGAGWGFIQIPRIGQEVIVDFLDGDPDRPIVTGRVYNAAQMPPYGLSGHATQSGWKSNSSPGGGGYNELMFEDKAGEELVNFQAQKDHALLVKHDRSKHVGHDQSDRIDNDAKQSVGVDLDEDVGNNKTTKVGVDRTVSIGSNDTESVGKNRSLSVGIDETIGVGSNSTETIGANHTQTVGLVQTVTVGAARVDTVGAAETRTVGAAQVNTIGAMRQVSVGLAQSHDIGVNDSWSIGTNQTVSVGAAYSLTVGAAATVDVGAGRTTSIAQDDKISVGGALALSVGKAGSISIGEDGVIAVGKALSIEAQDSIVLKCGAATISMKKDGTITLDGKDITLNGSGKITVKASSDVIIKGSSIKQN